MMLDPNYRTSFDNLDLLIAQNRTDDRLYQAYQSLFSAVGDQGMTQELALQLETRFGGDQGIAAFEEILRSTQGLGVEAIQQAIQHAATPGSETPAPQDARTEKLRSGVSDRGFNP